jgi:lysyl-tRNA synthetase class 2
MNSSARTVIRIPVNSSNLQAIAYDRKKQILEVDFVGGTRYRYFGVPAHVFNALRNAQSHGSYFYTSIRTAYRFEEVS